MNLEQQLCSLDLAKRLKELEVKQESYFVWKQLFKDTPDKWRVSIRDIHAKNFDGELIAAFTVAELGEMLPKVFDSGNTLWPEPEKAWVCGARLKHHLDFDEEDEEHVKFASTEADARAKMLIYLLENKLIAS